jgi:hypothetical protein
VDSVKKPNQQPTRSGRHSQLLIHPVHVYEVRPRKDHRGFDLISDALPFGGLWYGEPDAISNAMLRTICGIGLLAVRPVALSCAFH